MDFDFDRMAKSRQLSVPDFGPYSMTYAGVSHIRRAENKSVDFLPAFRLDGRDPHLSLHDKRSKPIDFHAYNAAPDLTHFEYKFDLEGLEDICAYGNFLNTDNTCSAEIRLVNGTDRNRKTDFELAAVVPGLLEPTPELELRPGEVWTGAENYESYEGWHSCPHDGYRNMVRRKRGAVDGVAVASYWEETQGTVFGYSVELAEEMDSAWLGVRYMRNGDAEAPHFLEFAGNRRALNFDVKGQWAVEWVELGSVGSGRHEFCIGTGEYDSSGFTKDYYGHIDLTIAVDGFVLLPSRREDFLTMHDQESAQGISAEQTDKGDCVFLIEGGAYALGFDLPQGGSVELLKAPELFAADQDFLEDVAAVPGAAIVRNLELPAGGEVVVNIRIAYGSDREEALKELARIQPASGEPVDITEGIPDRFSFGYRLLASNALMNISYPVFTPDEIIATYTPGKRFGGLYLWDAGMHGIGLLEVAPKAAVEILNVYLCGPEDEHDFIAHGTPLPIAALLANEIWTRLRDRDLLVYLYPRLRRFYEHLAGRTEESRTNRFGTDLINTFPIFYNSGGWDDLPPQTQVHYDGLEDKVTPVVPTAMLVRFARIMKRFASELFEGEALETETGVYGRDIEKFTKAIERTWDGDEQLYSYVWHENFEPFRHEDSGWNYNHTLESLTPLVSGGISRDRADILLSRFITPGRFLTSLGLSTIDQSAPYYMEDGYWNGAVWVPYQWVFMKALLDYAQHETAMTIARLIAETWEREARRNHCSFELFRIATGLGDGYEHFAGLSTPVLAIIAGISKPGSVTTGFDSEYRSVELSEGQMSFEVRSFGFSEGRHSVVAVPGRPGRYRVSGEGIDEIVQSTDMGAVAFSMPKSSDWQGVEICPGT